MAIKRPLQNLTTFSMSSMTDVIFLLLIFFMITSTVVSPNAIKVLLPQGKQQTSAKPLTRVVIDKDLPQSGEQSSRKPVAEIYITADSLYYFVADRNDTAQSRPQGPLSIEQLGAGLVQTHRRDSVRPVAIYADTRVPYGKVVEVMDVAARCDVYTVLATKATQKSEAVPGMDVPDAPEAAKPIQ